jgi:DNA polymerase III alpha subunit
MHIGRGSGANSIISYCLGITNICPLELTYTLNVFKPESQNPPDFDIDWSWKSGIPFSNIFLIDTVEIVWLCGTNVEFKYRSIFREVGKFLVYKEELDALAKKPSPITILIL